MMIRYAVRAPGLASDGLAAEELRVFETERRPALVLQAGSTVLAVLRPRGGSPRVPPQCRWCFCSIREGSCGEGPQSPANAA